MKESAPQVLLVEDNDIDVEALRRSFRRSGIENEVVRAVDGLEALQILRGEHETMEIGARFVVLLDLRMPRMDGLSFLKEIRRDTRLRDVLVFVLTSSKLADDLKEAYSRNIAGYVVKGGGAEELHSFRQMLQSYLNTVEFPSID